MAKKGNLRTRLSPKTNNPIVHIPFQQRDRSQESSGGGGVKEFSDITPSFRHQLQQSVTQATTTISQEESMHPDIPGVLVIRLRNDAIAKSHRPVDLVRESGMFSAGHAKINEMLVTASVASMSKLNNTIATRDVKKNS